MIVCGTRLTNALAVVMDSDLGKSLQTNGWCQRCQCGVGAGSDGCNRDHYLMAIFKVKV